MQMELKNILIKLNNLEIEVGINQSNNSVWISQKQLSLLFGKSAASISEQSKKLLNKGLITSSDFGFSETSSGKKQRVYRTDILITFGVTFKSNMGELLLQKIRDYLMNEIEDTTSNTIIYNNGSICLSVAISPKEDTVWMSQNQLSILYDSTKQLVSYHIKNILEDGELDNSTVKEILTVQNEDGKDVTRVINYYNLEMIISVGYRINSKKAVEFRRWATKVLKQYLLKGYAINEDRTLVTNENYINLINKVENIDQRLGKLEGSALANRERIFFNGEYFDARSFLKEIFAKAEVEISLIDPYADILALDFLKVKKKETTVKLLISDHSNLTKRDIDTFNSQYGRLKVRIDNHFHDRFIVIDGKELYHLGASLNYAGKRIFAISKMENEDIFNLVWTKIYKLF